MESVEQLVKTKMRTQGPDDWQSSFQHTWNYAINQWQADEILLNSAENEVEEEPASEEDDVE